MFILLFFTSQAAVNFNKYMEPVTNGEGIKFFGIIFYMNTKQYLLITSQP